MPIGIVSNDDFLAELEKLRNGIEKRPEPNLDGKKKGERSEPGRGEHNVAVPEVLRSLIGQTAIESGRTEALNLARAFDISPSSVSAYAVGATSTATYQNPEPVLKKRVDATKERIGKIARGRLLASLRHITDEKLEEAKLRDIAAVSASMSAVVKNMEPARESGLGNINIVLYAPKIRAESTYEVVEADSLVE